MPNINDTQLLDMLFEIKSDIATLKAGNDSHIRLCPAPQLKMEMQALDKDLEDIKLTQQELKITISGANSKITNLETKIDKLLPQPQVNDHETVVAQITKRHIFLASVALTILGFLLKSGSQTIDFLLKIMQWSIK